MRALMSRGALTAAAANRFCVGVALAVAALWGGMALATRISGNADDVPAGAFPSRTWRAGLVS